MKIIKSENYKNHTIEIYWTSSIDYGFKVIYQGQTLYQSEPYTFMVYAIDAAKLYIDQMKG